MAPIYLVKTFHHRTTDVDARRHLRSADSSKLIVPPTRRSTLGDWAFSVAAPRAWNSVPREPRDRVNNCFQTKTKNSFI